MSKIYISRFPSFWKKMDEYVNEGKIISVKEAYKEVTNGADEDDFLAWIKDHRAIFKPPDNKEAQFVAEIFKTKNFRDSIRKRELLKGTPVADPFIIASAKIRNGTVVTEERYKLNSAKIPTVCEYFGIKVINFETFMTLEKWSF